MHGLDGENGEKNIVPVDNFKRAELCLGEGKKMSWKLSELIRNSAGVMLENPFFANLKKRSNQAYDICQMSLRKDKVPSVDDGQQVVKIYANEVNDFLSSLFAFSDLLAALQKKYKRQEKGSLEGVFGLVLLERCIDDLNVLVEKLNKHVCSTISGKIHSFLKVQDIRESFITYELFVKLSELRDFIIAVLKAVNENSFDRVENWRLVVDHLKIVPHSESSIEEMYLRSQTKLAVQEQVNVIRQISLTNFVVEQKVENRNRINFFLAAKLNPQIEGSVEMGIFADCVAPTRKKIVEFDKSKRVIVAENLEEATSRLYEAIPEYLIKADNILNMAELTLQENNLEEAELLICFYKMLVFTDKKVVGTKERDARYADWKTVLERLRLVDDKRRMAERKVRSNNLRLVK